MNHTLIILGLGVEGLRGPFNENNKLILSMKTLNLLIAILYCLVASQSLNAQQVYESRHYGTPGDLYLYNRFASGFSNEGMTAAGPGITWDMSTNMELNTHVNQVVEPNEGIDQ